MTIRFYNPFALIRSLQADVVEANETRRLTAVGAKIAIIQRDAAYEEIDELQARVEKIGRHLAGHSQANDEFMAERLDNAIIQQLDTHEIDVLADQLATVTSQRNAAAAVAVVALEENETLGQRIDILEDGHLDVLADADAIILDLEGQLARQASEIVEVISYVKAAEAALAEYGVAVEDGPNGPKVAIGPRLALPVYA